MRIAYFGTAEFAVPALRALSGSVVAVVTQPDKPSGRGLSMHASPVKQAAMELGLPVHSPAKLRTPEAAALLASFEADLFVVAAYGKILSASVLAIPRLGCLNLHGSLLPAWRGAAPIQRAIEAGDAVTGVTLMEMDEGMDTGGMIAKIETAIAPDETAGELTPRLAQAAAELAAAHIPRWAEDRTSERQDETLATLAPKVEKADAFLDPALGLERLYNRFRAFTPAPGAFFRTPMGPLKLLEARRTSEGAGEAGVVSQSKPTLRISFAEGGLDLIRVQPEGRKAMSGADFANGARLVPGTRLLEGVTFPTE